MTDQEKINQLEAENKQLKELIKEGKTIFSDLNDALGIEKAAKGGFMMAKMASLIMKVQSNPEIVENITAYAQKMNNFKID